MPLKVAKRGAVPPFIVMDVMRAAARQEQQGGDVLHMEVGQPATGAPKGVIEAAKRALDADRLGYTLAFGIPELQERIAAYMGAEYGTPVPADRICVTVGASGAFVLAFLAAFEAGDRVALASPGYPAYRNILSALGINPVSIPVGPETNFQPSPEMLDQIDGPIDGLIVASPSNPTGTMVTPDELKALAGYCKARGIRLISDEIYHGITFGPRAETALKFWDEAIVINSFSKYFSMTGWRLGWMVVPDSLARSVECLAQNLFISSPAIAQRAAIAVFDCRDELDANVARYAANRAVLLDALPDAGFHKLASADGAFYIYADVAHLTNDSQTFCKQVLAETGVAITPGNDFDPDRGHHFVRFSFAGATDEMTEAARRLKAWLKP